jgi:hypothetical protein
MPANNNSTKSVPPLCSEHLAWPKGVRAHTWLCRFLPRGFSLSLIRAKIVLHTGVLLSEIRSLIERMKLECEAKHFVPIGCDRMDLIPNEHPSYDTRLRACSSHIREMYANRSQASLGDLRLFVEGWDRGVMWAFQTSSLGSYSLHSESNSSLSENLPHWFFVSLANGIAPLLATAATASPNRFGS